MPKAKKSRRSKCPPVDTGHMDELLQSYVKKKGIAASFELGRYSALQTQNVEAERVGRCLDEVGDGPALQVFRLEGVLAEVLPTVSGVEVQDGGKQEV